MTFRDKNSQDDDSDADSSDGSGDDLDAIILPDAETRVWRRDRTVVTFDKTMLPARCWRCNSADDLHWHKEGFTYTPRRVAMASMVMAIPIAAEQAGQRRMSIKVALCGRHHRLRIWGAIALILGMWGVTGTIALTTLSENFGNVGYLILALSVLAILAGLTMRSVMVARGVQWPVLWLRKAGAAYLNDLPELTAEQEAQFLTAHVNNTQEQLMAPPEAWREGDVLAAQEGVWLPPQCVKCNSIDGVRTMKVRFGWHSPWLYLALLAGVIPYIVVLIAMPKVTVRMTFCGRHFARRNWGIVAAWLVPLLLFAAGMPVLLLLTPPAYAFVTLWALVAGVVLAALVGRLFVVPLRPVEIDDVIVRLRGAAPDYLDLLPREPANPYFA